MGWLDRITASDYKISDKLTISAGTPVYISAIGMHYDHQYFPEPLVCNPDRFLPENEKNIIPYLPFGEGPPTCTGQRILMMKMRFVLAKLVRKLEFRPLPGFPKPADVQFEKKRLFLMPGGSLSVEFVTRNN